jgi:hypothetical protein
LQQLGCSPAQIRALGGGATQFTINAGAPEISASQWDVGAFVGDEWRVNPALTLSLGLRYEAQSNVDHWTDFTPRLGIAWAPGATAKTAHLKTVVRAGFGIFYDRLALANTINARRYNGIVQQQYVVTNPDFFPIVPSISVIAAFQTPQTIQQISSAIRSPYTVQSAISLERQLPFNSTLALTYANAHGVHLLRSRDINAPFLSARQTRFFCWSLPAFTIRTSLLPFSTPDLIATFLCRLLTFLTMRAVTLMVQAHFLRSLTTSRVSMDRRQRTSVIGSQSTDPLALNGISASIPLSLLNPDHHSTLLSVAISTARSCSMLVRVFRMT